MRYTCNGREVTIIERVLAACNEDPSYGRWYTYETRVQHALNETSLPRQQIIEDCRAALRSLQLIPCGFAHHTEEGKICEGSFRDLNMCCAHSGDRIIRTVLTAYAHQKIRLLTNSEARRCRDTLECCGHQLQGQDDVAKVLPDLRHSARPPLIAQLQARQVSIAGGKNHLRDYLLGLRPSFGGDARRWLSAFAEWLFSFFQRHHRAHF